MKTEKRKPDKPKVLYRYEFRFGLLILDRYLVEYESDSSYWIASCNRLNDEPQLGPLGLAIRRVVRRSAVRPFANETEIGAAMRFKDRSRSYLKILSERIKSANQRISIIDEEIEKLKTT